MPNWRFCIYSAARASRTASSSWRSSRALSAKYWKPDTMRYILLCCICLVLLSGCQQPATTPALQTGAEQTALYLPLLAGKRVGLLVNQTSMVGEQHLVDLLLANNVNVVSIFAPEHGFRGDHDAGASVKSGIDSKTGLPLWSLYGANKQPAAEQ